MCSISHSKEYSSASVNRYSNCLDFRDDLLCFGAQQTIQLYCVQVLTPTLVSHRNSIRCLCLIIVFTPQTCQSVRQLVGHTSRVNCVKWIDNCDHWLISSSADKTSIIWDLSDVNSDGIKLRLIGHNQSVMVCHSRRLSDNQLLSISSSTDNCTKIWLKDKQICELITKNFVFDIKVCESEHIFDAIVIFIAGANETIDLYHLDLNNKLITSLFEIKGHEDWIRSIDIFQIKSRFQIKTIYLISFSIQQIVF